MGHVWDSLAMDSGHCFSFAAAGNLTSRVWLTVTTATTTIYYTPLCSYMLMINQTVAAGTTIFLEILTFPFWYK